MTSWARNRTDRGIVKPSFSAVFRADSPAAFIIALPPAPGWPNQQAYEVAEKAHSSQVRKSGEAYIHHPVAVATIVAELGLDDVTIASALLHDAVEDTGVTVEDVSRDFGPEVAARSGLDSDAFLAMIDNVVSRHPQIKVLATTLREVHSTNRHTWSAVAWITGRAYVAPTCELDVYDRVGGGDGFAAGLFYGLLTGEAPEDCVKLGWAHGAMITAFPGDTTMATLDQVRAFAQGGSARIQR